MTSLPYNEPDWAASGLALSEGDSYRLNVIKEGVLLEPIILPKNGKSYLVLGRLPLCDISLSHDSISRFHIVMQFDREGRPHLFDLNSIHGSYLNKKKLSPYQYTPFRPGDFLKLGASTRLYVLEGGELEKAEAEEPKADEANVAQNFVQDIADYSLKYPNPRKSLVEFLETYDLPLLIESVCQSGTWQSVLSGGTLYSSQLMSDKSGEPLNFTLITGKGETKKDAELSLCLQFLSLLEEEGLLVDEELQELQAKRLRTFYKEQQKEQELDPYFDRASMKPFKDTKIVKLSKDDLDFLRFELMDFTGLEVPENYTDLKKVQGHLHTEVLQLGPEILQKFENYIAAVEKTFVGLPSLENEASLNLELEEDFRIKVPKSSRRTHE